MQDTREAIRRIHRASASHVTTKGGIARKKKERFARDAGGGDTGEMSDCQAGTWTFGGGREIVGEQKGGDEVSLSKIWAGAEKV